MKSGIYLIRNREDGRVYIGQSVYLKRRLSHHKNLLKRGMHENEYLQRSFSKSPDSFEFSVLEYCEKQQLDKRECYWIEHFKSNVRSNGYNIESGGHLGHTWNRDAKLRRSGEGNPMYGKNHSVTAVEKIRSKNRGQNNKLTEQQVCDIKKRLANGESEMDLVKEYGVTISTISKILVCKNWEWLCPELNERLLWIKENRNAERNDEILRVFRSGKQVSEICSDYGYSETLVRAALGQALVDKIANDNKTRLEKRDAVRADFEKGMPKKEIMEKHQISQSSYIRYTTDLFNEKKDEIKKKCVDMRKSGMKVTEIAKELGLHRTTVTEYTKHLVQANTESAETDRVCNDYEMSEKRKQ